MPPRFAYWTILVGGLPTAFRSAERDELMPTFKRLQEKHADAEMRWFARGKLWSSPEEASAETRGRSADADRAARDRTWRPGGSHQDPRQPYKDAKKRGNQERRQQRFERKQDKEFTRPNAQGPMPKGDRGPRRELGAKPDWKKDRPVGDRPKWSGEKPSWKRDQRPAGDREARPLPTADRAKPKWAGAKPEWRAEKPAWKREPRPTGDREPRALPTSDRGKPKWEARPPRPEWKRDQGPRPKADGDQFTRPNAQGPMPKRDRWPRQDQGARPAWKKDGPSAQRPLPSGDKPAWRDQGPRPKAEGPGRKPEWRGEKPAWKKDRPQGAPRPEWKREQGPRPKAEGASRKPEWRGAKPEWKKDRPEGATRPKWGPPRSDRGPRPPGPRGPKR